jgi:hypothetical protein
MFKVLEYHSSAAALLGGDFPRRFTFLPSKTSKLLQQRGFSKKEAFIPCCF